MSKILIVEDEEQIAEMVKEGLEMDHHQVDLAHNGRDGLLLAREQEYDGIVLDLLLPELNGVEACREIRGLKVSTPIIMLTACDTTSDRIKGLNAGADDYLVKPFALNELLARVRALLRRSQDYKGNILKVGDLVMDTLHHRAWRGEKELKLTPKEYEILAYMMRRPNIVCTRTMLNDHIWGFDTVFNDTNTIDSFINHLRRVVDRGQKNKLIHTVRHIGYKLADKSQANEESKSTHSNHQANQRDRQAQTDHR
jgi:DNA-binding response OmpR family regulator